MHKIFANGFWLLLDKVSKLFIGLIVIAKVAQHLGPAKFGIWNYCIALTTIVGVLATLGLEKIVVKELVNDPEKKSEIIATSIFLRIVAGFLSLLVCMGIVYFAKQETIYLYCTFILSLTLVLQSFDVYDYYYQSQYLNKRTIIPKVAVFIVFSLIRILFIHYNFGLISFVWLSFWELFFTYLIIVIIFLYNYREGFSLFGNLRFKRAANLITQSWPLIFTGLAIIVYLKIDQLLLGSLSNPEELGQYVAAARISELWYALPMIISIAILPFLVEKAKTDKVYYYHLFEMWLRFSFWVSVFICVVVSIFSQNIINFLYGPSFSKSATILKIHIWASISVFLGIVISQYLIIEGKTKVNLIATVIATLVNIILNLLLIPVLGAIGAAISTVSSYSAVFVLLLIFDKSKKGIDFAKRILYINTFFSDMNLIWKPFKIFISNKNA